MKKLIQWLSEEPVITRNWSDEEDGVRATRGGLILSVAATILFVIVASIQP